MWALEINSFLKKKILNKEDFKFKMGLENFRDFRNENFLKISIWIYNGSRAEPSPLFLATRSEKVKEIKIEVP